jgi:hypothetical protein
VTSPAAVPVPAMSDKPAPIKQTRGGRSLKPIDPAAKPTK